MPFCHGCIVAPLPAQPTRWKCSQTVPNELCTIGDHIKARRIQLHSFQSDVAKQIGVHIGSIQNWERNVGTPLPGQIPAVIRFLGYVPFQHNGSASDRLRWLRTCAGWTQDELAAATRCGVSSVGRLESGEFDNVMKEFRKKVERVLQQRLARVQINSFLGNAVVAAPTHYGL